jgi:hypothetical protein
LPFVAISLAALMGFAGIAVDVGYLEYWQQRQQTATDAAAMGGAEYLAHSNCSGASAAAGAALYSAQEDGFLNSSTISVNPVTPPSTGPYAGNHCAMSVQVTASKVSTFFARLFGYSSGMSESTNAVGLASGNAGGTCIYLLNPSNYNAFDSGITVNSPGCGIAMNGTADFNGGTITVPYIGYAGGTPNYGNPDFTMASPQPMLPIADPCPQIPGCAYLAANAPAQTNCQNVNTSGNQTLTQGCYSGLNLNNGSTVTLSPGVYVITGNINDNGAVVTGSGVTLYIASGGNGINIDNDTFTLTPPTPPANTANVLYYQVPSNTSSVNFNGGNINLQGLIYAPGTTSANFDTVSNKYTVLVFGGMNFNSNQAVNFASPAPGASLTMRAVLAQ